MWTEESSHRAPTAAYEPQQDGREVRKAKLSSLRYQLIGTPPAKSRLGNTISQIAWVFQQINDKEKRGMGGEPIG